MKVKEIIPIIDDIIGIYNKNRNIIVAFGETDVDSVEDSEWYEIHAGLLSAQTILSIAESIDQYI